jgi:hypothetical protein
MEHVLGPISCDVCTNNCLKLSGGNCQAQIQLATELDVRFVLKIHGMCPRLCRGPILDQFVSRFEVGEDHVSTCRALPVNSRFLKPRLCVSLSPRSDANVFCSQQRAIGYIPLPNFYLESTSAYLESWSSPSVAQTSGVRRSN